MASTEAKPSPYSPLLALERHLGGALLASAVAVLLLVARNALAPRDGPFGFGLVFWGWLALFYAGAALALWMVGWLMAAAASRPAVSRWLSTAVALGWLGAALLLNPRAVRTLVGLDGPARYRWLCPLALLLCSAGVALAALLPRRGTGVFRLTALLGLGAAFFGLLPGQGSGRGGGVAPRPGAPRTPLAVIGVDGADWRYIEPLIARGLLPHFAALRERGAWGPLRTLRPTRSPAIWTSIVTGKEPRRHGVQDFTMRTLRGVNAPLPALRPLRGLGFARLLEYLETTRRISDTPTSGGARRVAAFWNVASAYGSPVTVVGWWATWPAEPVLGTLVSDRAYFEELVTRGRRARPAGLAFPPEIDQLVAGLTVLPQEITRAQVLEYAEATPEEFVRMQVQHPSALTGIEYELTYDIATFETSRRLGLRLTDEGRRRFGLPPDLLLMLRLVDMTCHLSLAFSELVDDHAGAAPEELRRFSRVVTAAYVAVDKVLGEVEERFPGANVVVVSDHGFALEDGGYDHRGAPDGVFLAAGPAFQRAHVADASVYDVLPLLLHLKGFAMADDLAGALPAGVLRPAFLAAHPVSHVASYGERPAIRSESASEQGDAEMKERLRALGYLN